MKHLRCVPFLVVGLLAVSACPGGVESRVCKRYFEAVEQCAAKVGPERAEQLRSMAALAREGFTKHPDKTGVEDGCRGMLATLEADPGCK